MKIDWKKVVVRFPLVDRLERIVEKSKAGDKWSADEVRVLRKLKRIGRRIDDLTSAI